MVTKHYVVGIDGGATKTVAILGDETGRILGRGKTGSSNFHNISSSMAGRAIKQAVHEARTNADLVREPIEIAVVALAGVDSPGDKATAYRFVEDANIARTCFIVHDSIAALSSVTQGEPGVIVISGTGSVAAGINSSGQYARVGGWGYLISDEGSAFEIGRRALMIAFRSLDGRAPPTKLVSLFKRRYRVRWLEDALGKIYSNGLSINEVARLAPLISEAASKDETCRLILKEAGVSLAELACAVAKRLKMTRSSFKVATAGGNFRAGRYLLVPFEARIRQECPRARFKSTIAEPARGAFALAVSALKKGATNTKLLHS